jgi:hypothetical protein
MEEEMRQFQEIGPSIEVTGDDPRWHRFTPMVWQAAAMDFPNNLPSIAHLSTFDHPMNAVGSPGHITTAQAFSAALQLSRYALGWSHGARGFARWSELGLEGLTPHLRVIAHLLGPHVQHLGDWLDHLNRNGTNPLNTGGYDTYHLEHHSLGPKRRETDESQLSLFEKDNRKILLIDSYLGWYRILSDICPPFNSNTTGIDVFCTPVGWLGCYKRSPKTNIAHCTTEEIHLWDYTS